MEGIMETTQTEKTKRFPICGPRQPVYDHMRNLGFSESNWSDKHWQSADGIEVQIWGAGSKARVYLKDRNSFDCELDDLAAKVDELRRAHCADMHPAESK